MPSSDQGRQRKVEQTLGWLAVVTYAAFALIYQVVFADTLLVVNNSLASLIYLALVTLLWRGHLSSRIFCHLIVGVGFITVTIICYRLGGVHSPTLFWLLTPLVASSFLIHGRATLLWAGYTLSVFGGFMAIEGSALNAGMLAITPDQSELMYKACFVGVLLLATIFGIFYTREKDRAIQQHLTNNRRINTLLRILGHDLCNPLSILSSYAHGMRTVNPAEADKYLRQIGGMNEIITASRDLTAFYANSSGRKEQYSLAYLVEETVAALADSYEHKAISIDHCIPRNVAIKTHAPVFRNQILKNLIGNAYKFSDRGSNILIDYIEPERQLKIVNNGGPLPTSNLDRLFDYADNVSTPGTSGETGNGCGLPIVKDCCDQLGISIDIESEPALPLTVVRLTFPQAAFVPSQAHV